jgi:hypothetical protein
MHSHNLSLPCLNGAEHCCREICIKPIIEPEQYLDLRGAACKDVHPCCGCAESEIRPALDLFQGGRTEFARLHPLRISNPTQPVIITAAKLMSQGKMLRSGRILPSSNNTKQPSQPVDVSSLCFRNASIKRDNNEITEDEFLQALLVHCNGTRHGKNQLCTDEPPRPGFVKSSFADDVFNVSRFTASIALWISKEVCKDNTRTIGSTI